MAGDWIKMRCNLWDDPRVARLCDATDQPEAMIVGGLYWLWAMADQHTEDGILPGLTLRAIDRKTGIQGLGEALCDIGWLADHPDGVRIVGFEEHNGSSAKKRCQTAKRVASFKAGNAQETPDHTKGNAESVTKALAERDLEKRREEKKELPDTHTEAIHGRDGPTDAGRVCLAMKRAGVWDVSPGHPDLLALLKAGATDEEFEHAANSARVKGKGFQYALGTLKRQRTDAANLALHKGPMVARETPEQAAKRQRIAEMTGGIFGRNPATVVEMHDARENIKSLG
jgi:hypothetical protein